ncbi:helix-turn-helix transcriptional regulator [Mycobacterium sp. MS3]|uniref:helix-turn-helix transcriptional regulator n=1 Tax=Mycobacterium sp. MS3 TaxID=3391378 RepID=UPI0039891AEC
MLDYLSRCHDQLEMNRTPPIENAREKTHANSILRGFDRAGFANARIAAGLTVRELGNRAGVDRAAIVRWESGQCLPLVSSLSLCAAAMAKRVDDFLTVPESEQTLADLRMVTGLTQVKLCERTGLSRKVLGTLERGRGQLTDQRIEVLADALKVSHQAIRGAHKRSAILT